MVNIHNMHKRRCHHETHYHISLICTNKHPKYFLKLYTGKRTTLFSYKIKLQKPLKSHRASSEFTITWQAAFITILGLVGNRLGMPGQDLSLITRELHFLPIWLVQVISEVSVCLGFYHSQKLGSAWVMR